MKTTAAEIKTLIEAKLGSVQIGSDNALAQVFGNGEDDMTRFPCAVVEPTGWDAVVIDTHRNERTFHFRVSLYQEISDQATQKAQANDKLLAVADAVILAFDRDRDLGNEVEIVNPVRGTYDFTTQAGRKVFATVEVDARVIVHSYTPSGA